MRRSALRTRETEKQKQEPPRAFWTFSGICWGLSKKTEDAIQGPFSEMLFKQTEPQQNFSWADPRAERERGWEFRSSQGWPNPTWDNWMRTVVRLSTRAQIQEDPRHETRRCFSFVMPWSSCVTMLCSSVPHEQRRLFFPRCCVPYPSRP